MINLSFSAVFTGGASDHSGCLPVGLRGTLGAPGWPVQAKCDISAKTVEIPNRIGHFLLAMLHGVARRSRVQTFC